VRRLGETDETRSGAARNRVATVPPKNPPTPTTTFIEDELMQASWFQIRAVHRAVAALALVMASGMAGAADAPHGIEQSLNAALQDKRGITLYVNGQTVSGAVTRIEPGLWVEMKSQQFGKMIVRIDRIDGIAAP
jgi:hypothetical protein